jgi:hypothetical protein
VQTFKDGSVVFSNGKSSDKSKKSSFFKFWKKHHGKEGPFPYFLMKDENQKSVPPTLMVSNEQYRTLGGRLLGGPMDGGEKKGSQKLEHSR